MKVVCGYDWTRVPSTDASTSCTYTPIIQIHSSAAGPSLLGAACCPLKGACYEESTLRTPAVHTAAVPAGLREVYLGWKASNVPATTGEVLLQH